MVTVKIILETRKPKKDGTYPLYLQICFQRKTTTRSTKIAISERNWDDEKKEIKRSHPGAKLLNQKLKKMFADLQSELLLADADKVTTYLKPKEPIVEILEAKIEKKTVYHFAGELINDLKNANKFGNAWVYESTVNALKGFHPIDDLIFEQIDYLFLDAYQKYLISRGINLH